jgi:hypothetical protein
MSGTEGIPAVHIGEDVKYRGAWDMIKERHGQVPSPLGWGVIQESH